MQYGSWTLLRSGGRKSLVRCVCGEERTVQTHTLRSGRSTSCGCLSGKSRAYGYKLKADAATEHPLYETWRAMKRRCLSPNAQHYHRYGGRGIKVCDRWLAGEDGKTGFECFIADVGNKPEGLTLDRIDNNGNYEPGNVRWAGKVEQQLNTEVMKARGGISLGDQARRHGLKPTTVHNRTARGWSLAQSVGTPTQRQVLLPSESKAEIRRRFVSGDPVNGARPLARIYGVDERTIRRIANGK